METWARVLMWLTSAETPVGASDIGDCEARDKGVELCEEGKGLADSSSGSKDRDLALRAGPEENRRRLEEAPVHMRADSRVQGNRVQVFDSLRQHSNGSTMDPPFGKEATVKHVRYACQIFY